MASAPDAVSAEQPTEGHPHAPQLISRSARRRKRRKLQQHFMSIKDGGPRSHSQNATVAMEKEPLLDLSTDMSDGTGALPSVLTVSEQFDPWAEWSAHLRASSMRLFETKIRIEKKSSLDPTAAVVNMYTPVYLPRLVLEPLDIGLGTGKPIKVSFIGCRILPRVTLDRINALRQITSMFLAATVPKYVQQENDYLILLRPDLPHDRLTPWLHGSHDGVYKGSINTASELSWTYIHENFKFLQTSTDISTAQKARAYLVYAYRSS
jgi:hypothetical protein